MGRYRKKPVVIEAVQIPPDQRELSLMAWGKLAVFMGDAVQWTIVDAAPHGKAVEITTLEGVMRGDPGDWIIRGVKGEYYPCKPDIFAATYDAVDEAQGLHATTE